jgi:hypothetical protein
MSSSPFAYRVGIMGCPPRPGVAWNPENLQRLKDLGFNTMQLNIAWGYRPADEPLTLEDVVELPQGFAHLQAEPAVPIRSERSPEACTRRKSDLKARIQLCQAAGMRTIFHFGAPNNAFYDPNFVHYIKGQMARCLLDGKTQEYYERLLETFAAEYPGVDDILMYTYDQDAWLCNEFGTCPHCGGVPLHERVTPFVNRMAQAWKRLNPDGRLWWEPWELSAGQVLKCVESLDAGCAGLSLHANIAEAQATIVADRWFKNTAALARSRGIPVLGENYLGAASEEVEPYTHLAHPLVTWRMLESIRRAPGVVGIKEYYGLLPDQEDPNLRATGLFLADPRRSEEELLAELAKPYGAAAGEIARFWSLTSEGMELFPWDASWFMREIGRSDPAHAMSAAFLRGYCAETPSWLSTRDAIFMKVNNDEPNPWMLEDVQLRCELASVRFQEALEVGNAVLLYLEGALRESLLVNLDELCEFLRRARAYIYHIRASNLAGMMRALLARGEAVPQRMRDELLGVMQADQENMAQPEPLAQAIGLFQMDLAAFLNAWYAPAENVISKGYFSLTSR